MAGGGYAAGVNPITASGSAAAPTAGTAFVSATAPPAGWYEITGAYIIAGAAESANNNVALNANGVQKLALISRAGTTGGIVQYRIPQILLDGVHNVTLTAIANAAVSTVYEGSMILQEVSD